MHITTLGIDVAKNVFQLHGVDAQGRAVLSRRVRVTWALLAHDEKDRQPAKGQEESQRFLEGDEQRVASHKEDSHQGVQRGHP